LKNLLIKLLPHMVAFAALFFLLPAVTRLNTPIELAVTILLVVNPAGCLAAGAVYGFRHGFKWVYLAIAPVLFILSTPFFYNSSANAYALIYMLFCMMGLSLGRSLSQRERMRRTG
jgi:hypothetical protein